MVHFCHLVFFTATTALICLKIREDGRNLRQVEEQNFGEPELVTVDAYYLFSLLQNPAPLPRMCGPPVCLCRRFWLHGNI